MHSALYETSRHIQIPNLSFGTDQAPCHNLHGIIGRLLGLCRPMVPRRTGDGPKLPSLSLQESLCLDYGVDGA